MFLEFKSDISGITPPSEFTYPHYYTPHELSLIASSELQEKLLSYNWQHKFFEGDQERIAIGKMFGVLVVKNKESKLGYLAAVSGKLQEEFPPNFLVPSIDNLDLSTFKDQVEKINTDLKKLKENQTYKELSIKKDTLDTSSKEKIKDFRSVMIEAKKERKKKRQEDHNENELIKESLHYKYQFKLLKEELQIKIDEINDQLYPFEKKIEDLNNKRKVILKDLQKKHFEQYNFLNKYGEVKNLKELFVKTSPPPGSGDCAAPKLLQFCFKNNLEPLCLAEFWWGAQHKSEIRHHKQFYPACTGRCKPILSHMLGGINVEKNPLLENSAEGLHVEVLFEDEFLIVINKPHGLLSVPGKDISDSIAKRFKEYFIVHRLDQETSGILILAKDSKTQKSLQSYFRTSKVIKRYIALLDGEVKSKSGVIKLPLRGDQFNRPYQIVCHEYGKESITKYEVLSKNKKSSLVHFFPQTGRTHQLRMHAAHNDGLNSPIIGDTLYGKKSNRLYLHADYIEFTHPLTKDKISIECPHNFNL